MKTVRFEGLEASLLPPTREFCRDIGLTVAEDGIKVTASCGKDLSVSGNCREVHITYGSRCQWFRALTHLPKFLEDFEPITEQAGYSLLSYMADCSRNAVYNLKTAKEQIRMLAGMGYNSMMLYTEDTYEVPDYKYFGYMRGRYTESELKELDDYAASFGLELIPCIQTLAHLTTALRWPDFDGYKDSDDILLVGDERTYKFIDACISQCAACFRSRQINIGMDEAHLIACGNYLKKNGYRKPSDVMLEHLNRVVDICHQHGFFPMMWSDMFFRMAYGGQYYIKEGRIPQEVIDKVPDGLELVYWDYYSMDREKVSHMLSCHKDFKNPVSFAGGAWKWYGFAPHNAFSLKSSELQLDECERIGVDRITVTGWGDDGAEASQFSNLPSLLYFAERCYGDKSRMTEDYLNRRAIDCFGISFDDLMAMDLPNVLPGITPDKVDHPSAVSNYLLYNDLLERFMDCHMNRETVGAVYASHAETLKKLASHKRFGYIMDSLSKLCNVLSLKADMGWRIYEAYRDGKKDALAELANKDIPDLIERTEEFLKAFRRVWYRENKTFGFVTQEIRIGGLLERFRSVRELLLSYLNGEVEEIEELKAEPLPYQPLHSGEYLLTHVVWRKNVAAGIL